MTQQRFCHFRLLTPANDRYIAGRLTPLVTTLSITEKIPESSLLLMLLVRFCRILFDSLPMFPMTGEKR
jgi:hypothetical protein